MAKRFTTLALGAALAMGVSGYAMAQGSAEHSDSGGGTPNGAMHGTNGGVSTNSTDRVPAATTGQGRMNSGMSGGMNGGGADANRSSNGNVNGGSNEAVTPSTNGAGGARR